MVKKLPADAGDTGPVGDVDLAPGSGRSPGERNSNPLPYSCLENSMDRGAWQARVHRAAKETDMTSRLNNDNNKYALVAVIFQV